MSFIKQVLAVITGILLYSLLFLLFVIAIVGVLSKKTALPITEKGILHITLDKEIQERNYSTFMEGFFNGDAKGNIGALELISAIEYAQADPNIKGIFLEIKMPTAGMATWNEIRTALQRFREKEKFVVTYAEVYTEGSYYLASVADEIYMPATGMIEFNGLVAESMYFKRMLDKLDISTEIFRAGKYKSAIEPFVNEKMSEEDREQITRLLQTIYSKMLSDIAKSRKIDVGNLKQIADSMSVRSGVQAKAFGLITQLGYRDEVLTALSKRLEVSEDELKLFSLAQIDALVASNKKESSTKIAVVYANGEIIQGKGNPETIGSESLAKTLRKLYQDDEIKAVVLRVNSPGGSALASDVIWREIELLKSKKKVVTLMSNVAASGGYYISMNSDYIMANPLTITGSIGVFGLLVNGKGFLENTVGITTDTVKTSPYAAIGSFSRPVSNSEKRIIQDEINSIYATFIQKAAIGRHLPLSQLEANASGRVWSGMDAQENKLVDGFGSLSDAVLKAASLAKISEYEVIYYPEIKTSPLVSFIEGIEESADDESSIPAWNQMAQHPSLRQIYHAAKMMNALPQGYSVQARLPYNLEVY